MHVTFESMHSAQPSAPPPPHSSPSAGYWDGADCANCLAGWSGTGTCTLPCPRNASNVVCSGRGTCREGLCYCDGSACGPSCAQGWNSMFSY